MKYTVYAKGSDNKKKTNELNNRNRRQQTQSQESCSVSCHRWMFCHVTLKHFDSPVCEAKQYEQLAGALKTDPLLLPC